MTRLGLGVNSGASKAAPRDPVEIPIRRLVWEGFHKWSLC